MFCIFFFWQKYRDFFKQFKDVGQSRFAEQHQSDVTEPFQENASVSKTQIFKTDVTYKFKEGYTNAVRRKIKMEDLLWFFYLKTKVLLFLLLLNFYEKS